MSWAARGGWEAEAVVGSRASARGTARTRPRPNAIGSWSLLVAREPGVGLLLLRTQAAGARCERRSQRVARSARTAEVLELIGARKGNLRPERPTDARTP